MNVYRIPLPAGSSRNDPRLIVTHAMAEYIHVDQATYDYYKGKGIILELGRDYHAPEWLRAIGLSAHRLIAPSGDIIICREDHLGGFHAKGFNTDSLGAEFLIEGTWTYAPMLKRMQTTFLTDKQLENGSYLIELWMKKHNIELEMVKSHKAIDPQRKYDPGVEAGRIYEAVKARI
jgi:hypothetical protein